MLNALAMAIGSGAFIASLSIWNISAGLAQANKGTCSFNGNPERCVVNWRWNGSSERVAQVTWLSDGKQTWYRTGGDGFCLITEDNDRKTNCSWSYSVRNIKFKSSRGNVTTIPSW